MAKIYSYEMVYKRLVKKADKAILSPKESNAIRKFENWAMTEFLDLIKEG